MNLIIIHFIHVSKVESVHICVRTIKSHSVYVDIERTRIVTMEPLINRVLR